MCIRDSQQIDARHQHALGAAVSQRDGLLLQPDEIGGQQALLRLAQRDPDLQAVALGESGAFGHQRLVLRVVIAVVLQKALARCV